MKIWSRTLARMSVFVQRVNPILGETTWEWQNEHYDYHQEIARSSYADMLHDTERNQKYCEALKLAIEKVHALGKRAKVLDIGTGTGLLSMMAVQCGADSVVACEAFSPMSACAEKIIDLNEYGPYIKVVNKHSTELTVGSDCDLLEKANILVTEVFDTELIGEGALNTFKHAQEELLESDCIVIPSSAVIYAQVISSPLVQNWNKFNDVYGTNGELLVEAPTSVKNCCGSAAVHDLQLSQLPTDSFKEIVAPQPVLHFDWSGKTPLAFNRCNVLPVKAECDGVAQAVFMWWEIIMDTESKIILSCAPYWAHPLKQVNPNLSSSDIPWRDHWMQAVYYLPKEVEVKQGQELLLVSSHDEYSLWFHLDSKATPALEEYFQPICECLLHCAHSRTMIGKINDFSRNQKYLSILKKYVTRESVVLIISDAFYVGLAAAKMGAKKVLYLDDNFLSTRVFKNFTEFNNLDNVEIVNDIEALKTNSSVKDIGLVLGQPHFSTTILPWDSLQFAYLVNRIRSFLPSNVVVAPKIAYIKAIIVEFKDLQKIRLPVETCGEFDMEPFDSMAQISGCLCDGKVEAQPLWEYPCIARCDVTELAKLDLQTMFSVKTIHIPGCFKFNGKPRYNGVVVWVDWDMEGDGETIITTGPVVPPVVGEPIQWDMHTRQGVHFLEYKIKEGVYTEFTFNVEEGKIKFLFC